MMRILHILNDIENAGNGINNAAIDLAAGQVMQGHSVSIVSGGGSHDALLTRAGIGHLYLNPSRKSTALPGVFLGIRKHIADFRPDVVHAHVRTGLLMAWCWSRINKLPLVAHVHNVHEKESRLMALADRVIAVSASVGTTMIQRGVPAHKVRVVLNGPLGSPRMLTPEQIPEIVLKQPSIVTVCGMNYRKGIPELINAFNQVLAVYPDSQLYLVGGGPDIEAFKALATETRSPGNIHFMGYQAKPQSYMKAATIFVLASHRDSFPLVIMEAREAGCAIVASNVDGIPEALDSGRSGILVPPGDSDGIATILCRLLGDKGELSRWKQCTTKGLDRFHYTTMSTNVEAVYREIVRRSIPG